MYVSAVLITGPTPKGIGEETVLALARGHPSRIILLGRTPTKYETVAKAIRDIDANVDVKIYGIDLGNLSSVRDGAFRIISENDKIDVLINNAGVSGLPFQKTVDGIETTFATNHVGHFLLTNMLMRLLLKSDALRIVNLTSGAYRDATGGALGCFLEPPAFVIADADQRFVICDCRPDYDDYNFEKREYQWYQAYGESKIARYFTLSFALGFPTEYHCDSVGCWDMTRFGAIWKIALLRGGNSDEKAKGEWYSLIHNSSIVQEQCRKDQSWGQERHLNITSKRPRKG